MFLSVLGDGTKVSLQRAKQWFGEDRLPDGWTRPQRVQGLVDILKMAGKIRDAVDKVNAGNGVDDSAQATHSR